MVFAPRSHNIGYLLQGEHPENSGGIGVGRSSQETCNIYETISMKRDTNDQ